MGCSQSLLEDSGNVSSDNMKNSQSNLMYAFVPGVRAPCNTTEIAKNLQNKGLIPSSLSKDLAVLRSRIEVMVLGEDTQPKLLPRKKTLATAPYCAMQPFLHFGVSALKDLQLAIEEYLPVLLGLVYEDSKLTENLVFSWINSDNWQQENSTGDARFELLSMLHLMAMLTMSQANILLAPKPSKDGCQLNINDESKRASLDAFLKASGILKCALKSVMSQMSDSLLKMLPANLSKNTLHALCMQALGQGIEIQLGFAVDNSTATIAVKRRLACEQLKCWNQVKDATRKMDDGNIWGQKHKLFVDWKLAEAKATAYYFHGLILGQGTDSDQHMKAALCLQLADNFFTESKKYCAQFSTTTPATRVPPLMGAMKYLSERIPRDAHSSKRLSLSNGAGLQKCFKLPDLPDFAIALQPEEYTLPTLDVTCRMS